jgi:PAS domain S-box-containing protein
MEQTDRFSASSTEDRRFRLLVEGVTDYAIYMLDPTGVVTSWNAGAARFKGYEASEIIGQHFSRFYTENDRETGLPAKVLETAAREGKFESEGWRVRKDGSRFWAHVVIDPIRTSAGELVGFAKITRDLSERKAAQAALRRSEEQFRLLVQSVTDYAIYMLDADGRITSWNAGAQRIKGYSPEEIIGEHFSRFYTEEDRKNGEPQRALAIAAQEGKYEKEAWRVRKDGTNFWASVVLDPIHDESGTVIGFAKITRDITERMKAQRALEEAQKALMQSQKMNAIGQLTGGVAHDFNNLLTAVLGSLELVRKRVPEDPKITSLIDNAIRGAQRGTVLTQRMLAFARRQELKAAAVDVPILIRGMADLLQRSVEPSIPIATHFPISLARVHADANQLELAVLNLAVNARDAMPDGGSIIIAAREEVVAPGHRVDLPPDRYVCLSVTDTGEGMDEATLTRAAEPFFTTKGVGKGTGLGLAMVHGMAEQSGGRLVLKSRLGEGTTAEIWLPISKAPPETAGADHEPAAPAMERETRRLSVLAVDDDSLVLTNTITMLEELGHTVFQATSGKEALDIIRRKDALDLVITDQIMPELTGSQLAEAIRAEYPDLPILLMTGYAEWPQEASPSLPKLAKPFSQEDLAQAIAAAVPPEQEKGRVLNFPSR